MSSVRLASLSLADPPERWEALGFTVQRDRLRLGDVGLRLGMPGCGIVGWRLEGLGSALQLDGLPWSEGDGEVSEWPSVHPNGALGIDHVVVVTPDFDRTATALDQAGLELRRIRDGGGFRQGFRRLGPAILELVEAREAERDQPARFWGLVVVVSELEALAERLGEHLARVKPAVQQGRRIATLRPSAGLSTKVAFMDPEWPRTHTASSQVAPHR